MPNLNVVVKCAVPGCFKKVDLSVDFADVAGPDVATMARESHGALEF